MFRTKSNRAWARRLVHSVLLASPSLAIAQTNWTHSPATPGDWFQSSNWSFGVPSSSSFGTIANGGTAQISSGSASASQLILGSAAAETVVHSSGQLSLSNSLYLGNGATGTYQLSGDAALTAPEEDVGYSGAAGTFLQTGGTNNVSREVDVGNHGAGTYQLDAGTLSLASAAGLVIGDVASGHFIQNGGSITQISNSLSIGTHSTAPGLYELNGGSLSTFNENIKAWGGIAQTGGTNTGNFEQIDGTYTQSGGTNTAQTLHVGGMLNYSGGSLATGTFQIDHSQSTLQFTIDPLAALTAITASTGATFFGILSLSLTPDAPQLIGDNDTFTLLDSASPITGSFANVLSGARLSANGGSFLVSYGAGSPFGSDKLVLSDFQATPEPTGAVIVLTGLLTFMPRHRPRPRCKPPENG